jgi:aryl-alcohol dehydrogenase-like predicted oxidoreductase
MEQRVRLGLGTWAFGDPYWGDQDRRDSVKAVAAALRGGITHFDTAQLYAGGRAEQLTGQQLRKVRSRVTIATKGMYRPPDSVLPGIKKSLRRLCSDYVDIFYLHWPKPGTDMRPFMEALEEARGRGLIRCIGASNVNPEQLDRLRETARIDYCQVGYSLLWRRPEADIVPYCRAHGIRVVTYSSLAQGLLAGRFRSLEEVPAEDGRRHMVLFRPAVRRAVNQSMADYYRLADELEIPPVQLALAWNLSRPWADTVLFGARNRSQVEAALPAAGGALARETERRLEELSCGLQGALPDEENIFGHRPR